MEGEDRESVDEEKLIPFVCSERQEDVLSGWPDHTMVLKRTQAKAAGARQK